MRTNSNAVCFFSLNLCFFSLNLPTAAPASAGQHGNNGSSGNPQNGATALHGTERKEGFECNPDIGFTYCYEKDSFKVQYEDVSATVFVRITRTDLTEGV